MARKASPKKKNSKNKNVEIVLRYPGYCYINGIKYDYGYENVGKKVKVPTHVAAILGKHTNDPRYVK